jgi:hypothetical protein
VLSLPTQAMAAASSVLISYIHSECAISPTAEALIVFASIRLCVDPSLRRSVFASAHAATRPPSPTCASLSVTLLVWLREQRAASLRAPTDAAPSRGGSIPSDLSPCNLAWYEEILVDYVQR